MELTQVRKEFSSRYLNEGFSGGEKKRMEILQMALLQPKLAILDETDSGLDIDALNTVAHGVNTIAEPSDMGVLIITHYQRILHMVSRSSCTSCTRAASSSRAARSSSRRSSSAATAGSARRSRPRHERRCCPPPPTSRSSPGSDVVYLDSAATSQTPVVVLDAMDAYYREYRASVHRGVYPLAAEATEAFETARERIAALTGSTAGETVLTRNATEAINLVAYSWGRPTSRAGDLIVLTEMEHHSNLVPWQLLAQRTGAELAFVPGHVPTGLLDLDGLDALLERGPKLVG
jgi:hypothetical protein